LWPDISPKGDLIAFAGYTVVGLRVHVPYRAGDDPAGAGHNLEQGPAKAGHYVRQGPAEAGHYVRQSPEAGHYVPQTYSPWATLPPTSWSPIVETVDQLRAGIAVNGVDVLGRHAYSASGSWLVDAPADAITPRQGVPDWDLGYVYSRWQPSLFVSAFSHTLFDAGPADEN
jgi:hypothetical protein